MGTFGQRRFPLFCLSVDMSCVKYIRIVFGGDHVDQSILIEFIRIISGISYYAR